MKSKLLFVGIGMTIFGLGNFFRYLPISHSPTFWNQPFPFEHLYNVVSSDGKGTRIQIGYLPLDEAVNDPYWLFWSLVLYTGIIISGYAIWRNRK